MGLLERAKENTVISIIILGTIVAGATYKVIDATKVVPLKLRIDHFQDTVAAREGVIQEKTSTIESLKKQINHLESEIDTATTLKREVVLSNEENARTSFLLKQKEQELELLQRNRSLPPCFLLCGN